MATDRHMLGGNLGIGRRTAFTILCLRSLALLKEPKHVNLAMDARSQGRENLGSQDPRFTNKSDGMEVDLSRKNEQDCGGLRFRCSLGMQATRMRGIVMLKKCFSWGICHRRSQGGKSRHAEERVFSGTQWWEEGDGKGGHGGSRYQHTGRSG